MSFGPGSSAKNFKYLWLVFSCHWVLTATLVEPRVILLLSLKRTKIRLAAGSKDTLPPPWTKIPKVGVALALLCVRENVNGKGLRPCPSHTSGTVCKATLVEPRVTPLESLNRTWIRLAPGSKTTIPLPLAKTAKVGVSPEPICVVTLALGSSKQTPVTGFV